VWTAELLDTVDEAIDAAYVFTSPERWQYDDWVTPDNVRRLCEVLAEFQKRTRLLNQVQLFGDEPALTDEDNQILMALNDRHPVSVKQADLEAATDISRRLIGDRLGITETRGFVHRREGERRGWGLTDDGRQVLIGR
jgi:hypothetical protein